MQTVRILQAVALMLIVALAASCASTKDYTSKLFAPRTQVSKDSQAVALRFLETGDDETITSDWVSTDIITGRDTVNSTATLDNFAKTFPAKPVVITKSDGDSTVLTKEEKKAIVEKKPVAADEPLAKSGNVNGVRSKKSREE